MAETVMTQAQIRKKLLDYIQSVDAFDKFEIAKQAFVEQYIVQFDFGDPIFETIEVETQEPISDIRSEFRRLRKNLRNRNYRARKAGKQELGLPNMPKKPTEASVRRLQRMMGLDLYYGKKKVQIRRNNPIVENILKNFNTLCASIYNFITDSGQNYERSQKSGNKSTLEWQRILSILNNSNDYNTAVRNEANGSITFGDITIDLRQFE